MGLRLIAAQAPRYRGMKGKRGHPSILRLRSGQASLRAGPSCSPGFCCAKPFIGVSTRT